MNLTSESLTFTVPLSFQAHSLAQHYCRQQSKLQVAKQIYLNTLALYAVNFYLQCLGYETDWETGESRHPLCLKFMDVADLPVKGLGKIECRPILSGVSKCQIPPEVQTDRIAYIAVEMSQSLKQATLLGFTATATQELSLAQLRSLTEFPQYLSQIRQTQLATQAVVNLKKWFEGVFETGWQAMEAVLDTNPKRLALVRNTTQVEEKVKRVKLVDLGVQLSEQAVVLAVTLTRDGNDIVRVLVRVHPSSGETYLPPNLKLTMLSGVGEPLQEVRSRGQDNYIQLRRFEGQTGDRFTIQVMLNDVSVMENFVL